MPSPHAALFDVDRTLLSKDTATLFARYRYDVEGAGIGELLRVGWWMLEYTLGIVDAPKVAEKALSVLRGRSEAELAQTCRRWYPEYVRRYVSTVGRERVRAHQEAGDTVALVTATTRYAAAPLARDLNIDEVVCTELEVDAEGLFTGAIRAPLCFGAGKRSRAERWADRRGLRLDEAVFYTDSITDLPLLDRVRSPVVVNPDRRLRAIAARRSWPIERW